MLVPSLDPALIPPPIEPPGSEEANPGARQAVSPAVPSINRLATVEAGINAYEAGDFGLAQAIWQRLARQNIPRAQYHLGTLLYEGRVGPPEPVRAYVLLTRAARAGINRAEPLRLRLRAEMSPDQRDEAEARAGGG